MKKMENEDFGNKLYDPNISNQFNGKFQLETKCHLSSQIAFMGSSPEALLHWTFDDRQKVENLWKFTWPGF